MQSLDPGSTYSTKGSNTTPLDSRVLLPMPMPVETSHSRFEPRPFAGLTSVSCTAPNKYGLEVTTATPDGSGIRDGTAFCSEASPGTIAMISLTGAPKPNRSTNMAGPESDRPFCEPLRFAKSAEPSMNQ